jgi:catechol 2,3-dioxygenase-like lactoylglutathione lyase family enzyme
MGLKNCRVEAGLAVSDLDRARRFYEQQLGLVPGEEEQEAVRYPCAERTGIFVYLSPDNAGKSPATLAGWFVDDLDQTMGELARRGVLFEQYDQPGIKTDERLRCGPLQGGLGQGSRRQHDGAHRGLGLNVEPGYRRSAFSDGRPSRSRAALAAELVCDGRNSLHLTQTTPLPPREGRPEPARSPAPSATAGLRLVVRPARHQDQDHDGRDGHGEND